MFLNKAHKFTLLEVQITEAKAKHFLPNDDILREKRVTGIFVLGRNGAGNGKSPLNRALVTNQAIAESYLTFMCDNANILENMPLSYLDIDPAEKRILGLDLQGITPTKSYIIFADTTSISVGQSVVLGVFYED